MKKIKPNYIVIPLITIAVAVIGSLFTSSGMPWYDANIIRPELTPPRWAFPLAWNTIFILTTASALILWNTLPHEASTFKKFLNFVFRKVDTTKLKFKTIFWLFAINAFLNVFWSFLFFANQQIFAAFIEMLFLEATLLALIFMTWKDSKISSILLWPYAIWVGFATLLTWQIYQLNS